MCPPVALELVRWGSSRVEELPERGLRGPHELLHILAKSRMSVLDAWQKEQVLLFSLLTVTLWIHDPRKPSKKVVLVG